VTMKTLKPYKIGCVFLAMAFNSVLADTVQVSLQGDEIVWTTTSGAVHDLVMGNMNTLLSSSGSFATSTTNCLDNDTSSTSRTFTLLPATGEAFWFLVRTETSQGTGTYDSESASQIGLRDLGIYSSGKDCPRALEPVTASRIIGPNGGSVVLGIDASINIPPAALGGDTLIELNRSISNPTSLPAPGDPASDFFTINPAGLFFLQPATITLRINSSSLPVGATLDEVGLLITGTLDGSAAWTIAEDGNTERQTEGSPQIIDRANQAVITTVVTTPLSLSSSLQATSGPVLTNRRIAVSPADFLDVNTDGGLGACANVTTCKQFRLNRLSTGLRTGLPPRSLSTITTIVLHSTNDPVKVPGIAPAIFLSRSAGVGIHYVVDRTGLIIQVAPDDVIANHARGANTPSIGIEIVHTVAPGINDPYATEALYSIDLLLRYLLHKYPSLAFPFLPRNPPQSNTLGNPGIDPTFAVDAVLTHHEVDKNSQGNACGTSFRKADPCGNFSLNGLVTSLFLQRYGAPLRPTVATVDDTPNGIGDLLMGSVLGGNIFRTTFTTDPYGYVASLSSSLEIAESTILAEFKRASFPCDPSKINGIAIWGLASRAHGDMFALVKDQSNSCATPIGYDIQRVINGSAATWEPDVQPVTNPVGTMTVNGSGSLWGAMAQSLFTILPGSTTEVFSTQDSSSQVTKPAFNFDTSLMGEHVFVADGATRSCTAMAGALWSNLSGTFSSAALVNDINNNFPNPCNLRLSSAVPAPLGDEVFAYEANSASILRISQFDSSGKAQRIETFVPGQRVRDALDLAGLPSTGFTGLLMGQGNRIFLYTSSLADHFGVPLVLIIKTK
jgi:hypothetical protein